MNREDFKGQAPLHKTLNKLRGKSSLFYQIIIYNNRSGLGEIYNRYLGNKKYFNDILLFVHDDVLIEDIFLSEKLNEAIRRFDVVGIAGGLTPNKGALRWFDPWENLTGAVGHPLLDGISMAGLKARLSFHLRSLTPEPAYSEGSDEVEF